MSPKMYNVIIIFYFTKIFQEKVMPSIASKQFLKNYRTGWRSIDGFQRKSNFTCPLSKNTIVNSARCAHSGPQLLLLIFLISLLFINYFAKHRTVSQLPAPSLIYPTHFSMHSFSAKLHSMNTESFNLLPLFTSST